MLRILVGIETNPHWEPLNDFDKVAAGIFRWQKAEQRSCGAREILDRPAVVATERIDMNVDRLTRAHVFELSFLEVCRHPDILKGNDGKQTLSWLNPLTEFDGFASNDTTDGRINLRIAKIQFRGAYISFGSLHFADPRLRLGLCVNHLLRSRSRLLHLCLSLCDEATRLRDLLLNRSDSRAVGLQHLRCRDGLGLARIVVGTGDLTLFN